MRSAEEDKLYADLSRWFNKLQRRVQKLIDEYYEDEQFFLHVNKIYTIVEEMKPEYRAILLSHGLTQFYNARETTTTLYTIQQKKVSVKARLYEPQIIREEDVGLFRTNPQIEDGLRNNTFQASDITLERVSQNITNNLADSYHDGLGIRDAGRKINKEFAGLKGWESRRIARTEINTAQNEGAFSAYDELGVEYHMWWTGNDARVRDSHRPLHGHIVAVGNTFSNGLLYPGDKSGPIKEWINCRCTTVPYIMPLGKMAPLGLTEFTEDQLVDVTGYAPITAEDALNGEYPLDYYQEGGVIDQYHMESPYRQLKNAIADELKGFVPNEDIEMLSSELAKHKLQTDKLKYERLSLWDNDGKKILNSFTEYIDSGVDLPDTVPDNYKFSIHNHPKGHSPTPSFEDINELLYSEYSFTTTTDNGLVLMKSEMRNIDFNRFERDLGNFYDKLRDDFSREEYRYLTKLDDAVSQGKISREKADLVENYKFHKYLSKDGERYCEDLDSIVRNYGMEIKYVSNSKMPKIDNFKQKQSFYRADFEGNVIGRGFGTINKRKRINTSKNKLNNRKTSEDVFDIHQEKHKQLSLNLDKGQNKVYKNYVEKLNQLKIKYESTINPKEKKLIKLEASKLQSQMNKLEDLINKPKNPVIKIDEKSFSEDYQFKDLHFSLDQCELENSQINAQKSIYFSEKEKNYSIQYLNSFHKDINGFLFKSPEKVREFRDKLLIFNEIQQKLLFNKIEESIKSLDSAIEKTYLIKDTKLYRSGEMDITLREGDFGIWNGFTSTSYQKRPTENFVGPERYAIEIYAPKGFKGLSLNDFFNFSNHDYIQEYEILLPQNQKFQVIEIDHFNKKAKVLLV